MASIGPQLPPHLQKRKRSGDDDDAPDSPTPKTRRNNKDGGGQEDDSEDDFGPRTSQPPPSRPAGTRRQLSIGPSIPPEPNQDEISLGSSEDSDTDLPPPVQYIGPSVPTRSGPIIGPALPPGRLDDMPRTNPDDEEDSDSDDGFGPAPPSASGVASSRMDSAHTVGTSTPTAKGPEMATKRDDWMLAPPTNSGPRAPDPTKLKARGFSSGRAAGSRGPSEISSIWTETPEEKARRLKDAVLGRADATAAPSPPSRSTSQGSEARITANNDRIRSYTEQTRGKSLYEEHQARQKSSRETGARKVAEEDDPSTRAFDKEKDMAISGSLSNSQRRDMLNKAANFGGRFQKGSYL
ncbi:hypothetical protein GQ53DRAFT_741310 [Thozetella sp. PMI_491]|nr:hypothetical protein GQ53DRAFT_741310 [Thozetella sp. PMI_491]